MGNKLSHSGPASSAGSVLRDPKSSKTEKSVAGSTLAQSKHPERVTSEKVASEAGRILHDPNEPAAAKSAAGSALAQREK